MIHDFDLQVTSAAARLLQGASLPPGESSGLCLKEKHICLCVVLVTSGARGLSAQIFSALISDFDLLSLKP